MTRDWLHVQSQPPSAAVGRVLLKTPHEIGVIVAHRAIDYGLILEAAEGGYILKCLKQTVFRTVRDEITEHSSAAITTSQRGTE